MSKFDIIEFLTENKLTEQSKQLDEKSGRNAPINLEFKNGRLKIEIPPHGDIRLDIETGADSLVRMVEKEGKLKATGNFYYNDRGD